MGKKATWCDICNPQAQSRKNTKHGHQEVGGQALECVFISTNRFAFQRIDSTGHPSISTLAFRAAIAGS